MRNLTTKILLLVLVGVRARDSPAYNDPCDYTEREGMVMCGDKCIGLYFKCYCGSDYFRPYFTDEHCCLEPGDTCTRELHWGSYTNGHCNEGRKVSKSSACNTTTGPRCYNSYQHSQFIGYTAYYTCNDSCVSWEKMCRGVSWCEGDHQVCGPDLRCPPRYDMFRQLSSSGPGRLKVRGRSGEGQS